MLEGDPQGYEDIQKRTVPSRYIDLPHHIVGPLWHSNHHDWNVWLEICRYTGWDPLGKLKPMKYRNFVFPFNSSLRVGTSIYKEWVTRINDFRPVRIAICGEAGSSKSYTAMQIARVLERDKFTIDQVVFEAKEFIKLQDSLGEGRVIIPEEPAYMLAAREWQKREQKQSIKVIETSRYLNNPLILPVVNRNLLDKIIREYYINYVIEMVGRGVGYVYFTWVKQFDPKPRRKSKGKIYMYWPAVELSRCGRTTCLHCPKVYNKRTRRYTGDCNKFIWPQYERKRDAILHKRRQAELESGEVTENDEIVAKIVTKMRKATEIKEKLIGHKGKYSLALICVECNVNRENGGLILNYLKDTHPIPIDPQGNIQK